MLKITILLFLILHIISANEAICVLKGDTNEISGIVTFQQQDQLHTSYQISGLKPDSKTILAVYEVGYIGMKDSPDERYSFQPLANITVNSTGAVNDSIQIPGAHVEELIGRKCVLMDPADQRIIADGVVGIRNGSTAVFRGNASYATCEIEGSTNGKNITGRVNFIDRGNLTKVEYKICGLHDGLHGVHIHQYGDLSGATKVENVGDHFNPFGKEHGLPPSTDRHVGDLGNIMTVNGQTEMSYLLNLIRLSGDHSIIGKAVIIHDGEDSIHHGAHQPNAKIATCVIGYMDQKPSSLDDIHC